MRRDKNLVKVLIILFLIILLSACAQRAAQKVVESIKTPEVNIEARFEGIENNAVKLFISAEITNPNPVEIDIDDILITVRGENQQKLQDIKINGGVIPARGGKEFSTEISIPLSIVSEKTLFIEMQTKVGAAGIEAKLPVKSKATIYLPELKEVLKSPEVSAFIKVDGITEDGLKITPEITIKNPNEIGIIVENLKIVTTSEKGEKFIEKKLGEIMIEANSESSFKESLTIPISSLNAEILITKITGDAGAIGVEERLPLNIEVKTQIPTLSSVLKIPQIKSEIRVKAVERKADIRITINNENPIGLILGDMIIKMFDKEGNKIGEGKIAGKQILANHEETLSGEVVLNKVEGEIISKIETSIGIEGVNERIPINAETTVKVEVGIPSPIPQPQVPLPSLPQVPLPSFP